MEEDGRGEGRRGELGGKSESLIYFILLIKCWMTKVFVPNICYIMNEIHVLLHKRCDARILDAGMKISLFTGVIL